jgi:uncharacterized protein DUF4410
MIPRNRAISIFFALAVVSGCASTRVTQQTPAVTARFARPSQIRVYDFIADPTKIPADSSLDADLRAPSTMLTAEELESGRRLSAIITNGVVADIQAMGLPAVQAAPGAAPQMGDGVIRGYLVSVQAGSAAKRLVIGFSAGSSEIDTVVETYVMTPEGLRELGSGRLTSSGSKTPGIIVPAAATIVTRNPIGLIIVGATRIYGEASGSNTPEGRAKATADAIAEQLKIRFREQGWIN